MKFVCKKHGEVEGRYIREHTVMCPDCYDAEFKKAKIKGITDVDGKSISVQSVPTVEGE